MKLEELQVYNLAMKMGEDVWTRVSARDIFAKDTVGKQWVRAADSVAANLSEGFGRYHYKENKNHCYYSRGSLFECRTWTAKAHRRGLISQEDFDGFVRDINTIGIKLNNYIRSIGVRPEDDRAKESCAVYSCGWDNNDGIPGANQ